MQATPFIQQRGGKNIAGRFITPSTLKAASLVNSIQPVNVTTTGSIQIGNNLHNLSAVQSLLNSGSVTQSTTGIRMKTGNRRNFLVGGIQSLNVNTTNGQPGNEVQTINCTNIQTVGTSQSHTSTSSQLSAGELQMTAGTLTAAPTIGTIQLTRNVQTLPTANVHVVANSSGSQTISATNKTTTSNNMQLNANAENIGAKGHKIVRLSNSVEGSAQASVGVPMSALSALLSGKLTLSFLK